MCFCIGVLLLWCWKRSCEIILYILLYIHARYLFQRIDLSVVDGNAVDGVDVTRRLCFPRMVQWEWHPSGYPCPYLIPKASFEQTFVGPVVRKIRTVLAVRSSLPSPLSSSLSSSLSLALSLSRSLALSH